MSQNNTTESRINDRKRLTRMCLLALFIAIQLAMQITGISFIPVGPLNMSFQTVPVAIGAMLLGPAAGALLGCVFGLCSLWTAVTGGSVMTNTFFMISPLHTILLCVGTRTLMGFLVGLIYKSLKKADPKRRFSCFVGGISAPLLNTLFFMGYIVLFFYQTTYIQEKVAVMGAANALVFVLNMVGLQGLLEAAAGCIIGGGVTRALVSALKEY